MNRPDDGTHYANGAEVFKAPLRKPTELGSVTTLGFKVCTVSEWCDPDQVVACFNAAMRVESLFEAIAHGDEKHRAWLKQAIEDHMAGRPVVRP